jgi:N-acetylneuraminic acid mutarotase
MNRISFLLLVAALAGCGGASPASRTSVEPASLPNVAAPRVASHDVQVSGALLPPMPVAVTSFGAATDGAHLYVLGGYHGTPHAYTAEGQSRTLSRLALEGGPWEAMGELDVGLQGLALVAHGDRLCRVGGNTVDAEGRMGSVPDAACWSRTEGWQAIAPLPAPRSSHDAVVVGDTLYVAGGWNLDGDPARAEWHDTLLALDLSAPEGAWRSIEAPFARRALALAEVDGKLVAIGGLTGGREPSSQVDVYDPATGTWSRGPDYPGDAFGVAAVRVGDAIVASARDGVLHRWRPGQARWERVGTLAFPRFFHRLLPVGPSSLVALGGIGGMHTHGRTAHVERIELEATSPIVSTWTMDYPGEAKNRQAMFLHEDFLYLFGGNDSLEQHDFEPDNFESAGWRLHIPSMQWERITDYPTARQTMQTALLDGRGVAVGGFGHDGTAAVSHPEAYTFDFASGAWSPRPGLPSGRTQFGLAAHGGALYVIGGLSYDPSRPQAFDHVTSILRTDDEGVFVEEPVVLPGPRRAFAGGVLDGQYYLVGGMREGFQLVEDCLRYDLGARTFATIACPPGGPRLSGDLVALNGRLYLGTGTVRREGAMESDRSIEVYEPASNTWSTVVEQLPFDTRHARMLAYRDRLLVVSTHRDDGRILLALIEPR